jgi:hypothetical protein
LVFDVVGLEGRAGLTERTSDALAERYNSAVDLPTPTSGAGDIGSDSALQVRSDREIFLEFYYPELKDLGKHFLTVVSAVLAFLVAFVERLINLTAATTFQRWFLILALGLLIISVASVGTGVYINFVAGGRANGSIIRGKPGDFKPFVRLTYLLYHVGGSAFVLALCLLAELAAFRVSGL